MFVIDCQLLNEFELNNLTQKQKGEVKIIITLHFDDNCILSCTVKEMKKTQNTKIIIVDNKRSTVINDKDKQHAYIESEFNQLLNWIDHYKYKLHGIDQLLSLNNIKM